MFSHEYILTKNPTTFLFIAQNDKTRRKVGKKTVANTYASFTLKWHFSVYPICLILLQYGQTCAGAIVLQLHVIDYAIVEWIQQILHAL